MNKITPSLVVVLLLTLASSCTQWDEFRKYTEDGEIVYPGKVQNLQILAGENRVQISGTLSPDTRVTEIRVFWNDFADSVVIAVTDQIRASGFDEIVNVDEGLRTFTLQTYDEFGNFSIPVSEIGVSYGPLYRAKVQNRRVESTLTTDSSVMVLWRPIDTSTGAQYSIVEYEVDGTALTVEADAREDTTELMGVTPPATISHQMVYLPEPNCVDLFYSDTDEVTIE